MEYKKTKPSAAFYNIAIERIIKDNRGITESDILYVGNDYETDVIGAKMIGLDTVWYNVNQLPNYRNLEVDDIDEFRHLINIVNR